LVEIVVNRGGRGNLRISEAHAEYVRAATTLERLEWAGVEFIPENGGVLG
jgi:hypothetical protein